MVLRTREKLLEVARQLFAYKGVENTTMSDIATASEKGRRTIYTYFSSKREIYEATIEQDSEKLVEQLRNKVVGVTDPQSKLKCFLEHRLNVFNIPVSQPRGVNFDSILHFDFNRIERVRKLVISKEKEMLNEILNQGIEQGVFDKIQSGRFITVLQYVLRSVDMAMSESQDQAAKSEQHENKETIIQFLINSLLKIT